MFHERTLLVVCEFINQNFVSVHPKPGYIYRMTLDSLFCPQCNNLLDYPGDEDFVVCTVCGERQDSSVFESRPFVTRSRHRHSPISTDDEPKASATNEGAVIKERCPKCGNPEMTFHTMQLRSADEGQTVFYVCPKCTYKYSVNT